jgi:hypothetical protein
MIHNPVFVSPRAIDTGIYGHFKYMTQAVGTFAITGLDALHQIANCGSTMGESFNIVTPGYTHLVLDPLRDAAAQRPTTRIGEAESYLERTTYSCPLVVSGENGLPTRNLLDP